MDPIQLLLYAVLLFVAAALLSLVFRKSSEAARAFSGMIGMAGGLVGCLAAYQVFHSGTATLEAASFGIFGNFALRLDGFAAFMIGMISLLACATSLYSISYVKEYERRGPGELGFFNNLFLAAMLMVVSVANAFYFLIFWEFMTLASYFLVIFEQEKKESVQAGYLYFLIAHIGTAMIMLAFFVLYRHTGSLDFASFRDGTISPATRNIVFLLAFFGFGAKAGIVPLHIWLPRAHPAAPSHASALLSGVMIKTAVYGIIRLCVDLLGAPVWWWGLVVLVFGAISAVLGILYALDERDLKRLLAYSSVENIGVILMGVGVGMIGMAAQLPALALVGFVAALYHTINHAVFKGLLFMGAGAVIYRTHTHNMDEMGGLARLMPWTGMVFLTGAIAIAAIPPLNGFVSEWFLYQALFIGSTGTLGILRVFGPILAMILGLVGALVAMCFVKAYGTTFTGPPRSRHASQAREVPFSMVAGMGLLALSAIVLGLGAPVVTPFIARIAAGVANISPAAMANGMQVFPAGMTQAALSTPLVFVLLAGLLTVPLIAVWALGGFRAGSKVDVEAWACGYAYSPQMSVSSTNFAQPLRLAYQPLYTIRTLIQKPLDQIAAFSKDFRDGLPGAEPVLERTVTRPILVSVQAVGKRIQSLHMGDVRMYCLYIFIALAVLLVVIFR
ncbi:MAG TPA: hydrogenase 4 subunit B [Anaerolineales bacterium]